MWEGKLQKQIDSMAGVLLLIVCVCFSGCYTIKQGTTMLSYLSKAVPLESLTGFLWNGFKTFAALQWKSLGLK